MAGNIVDVVKDRVKETTLTTGVGTITLAGAVSGYQAFSVIGNGKTTWYAIESGTDWEVGIGTYTLSGTTLSRDTILESSNSGSAITLAGTSTVFCTYPAEESISGLPHAAKMTQTGSQNITDGSLTVVTFNTADFATGIVASTSSNHFTIKRAGKYSICCQFSGSDSSGMASRLWLMPTLNGTALGDVCGMNEKETDDGAHYATLSFHLDLAVDDVIRLCVYTNGGGDTDSTVGQARWRPRMSIVEVR
ncbi:MAG: hypothetical protein GY826_03250 [Fuerstiella sp.]|nr:hypothetical protein [Fuerstiella sp.]